MAELTKHLNELTIDKAKLFLNDLQDDMKEKLGIDDY